MDTAAFSAVAACVAAAAAWYSNFTIAGREQRIWQKSMLAQAAAEVRDAYSLWHFAEDHGLHSGADGPNTAEELKALIEALADLCNRVGLAKSRFISLDVPELYEAADAAWGDLVLALYGLREFLAKNPDGGVYEGFRICSLDSHSYSESEFDSLVRKLISTKSQRYRRATRAAFS